MEYNTAEVGERLEAFIKAKSLSRNKFGALLGTSGTQIGDMIAGSKFGIDKLVGILVNFPALNLEWLLFGRGEMEKEGSSGENNQTGTNNFIGNKNRQKNLGASVPGAGWADNGNVIQLQDKLQNCERERDILQKELFSVQRELIETLKNQNK